MAAVMCRQALTGFPGVKIVDDPSTKKYPMPLTATSQYDVEVSGGRFGAQ